MAIFKTKEISKMSEKEINDKIKDLKLELIKNQISSGKGGKLKTNEIKRRSKNENSLWNKVDKTARHYGRLLRLILRGYWWDSNNIIPKRPLFVVGCSRAGTTLVYKTFSG